jgi:hypothetical protein
MLIIILRPTELHEIVVEVLRQTPIPQIRPPRSQELKDKTLTNLEFPYTNSRKIEKVGNDSHLFATKLRQVLDNLDFIWAANQHRSKKYTKAHNAFIEARQRLPAVHLPKASRNMKYQDRFVEFNPSTHELVPGKPIEFHGQSNYHDATEYLRKSYDISQEILTQYYFEKAISDAQKTREKLGTVVQNDPDNIMKEFTQKLDENLRYAEAFKGDSQRIVERIAAINKTQKDAEFNLKAQQNLNRIVEFDILFDEGKYEFIDLSEEGKDIIREFAEGLITIINDYAEMYPDQTITIKIKTIGYADELDFSEGTDLIEQLVQGLKTNVPQIQPARRKFLNKRLSLFRARVINEMIQQLVILSETVNKDVRLDIQPDIEGKGEEIPPGIQAPYPVPDQRRRICRISNILWSS